MHVVELSAISLLVTIGTPLVFTILPALGKLHPSVASSSFSCDRQRIPNAGGGCLQGYSFPHSDLKLFTGFITAALMLW